MISIYLHDKNRSEKIRVYPVSMNTIILIKILAVLYGLALLSIDAVAFRIVWLQFQQEQLSRLTTGREWMAAAEYRNTFQQHG
jgi:hypothetical protein